MPALRKSIGIACIMFCVALLMAQSKPHPCGSEGYKDPWLTHIQQNMNSYRFMADTLIYIPMTIHIVSNDNGEGGFSIANLTAAMCTLNEDFEESNLQFFIDGPIRYHNRSDYYNHETVLDGAYMMFDENVPGTLNNYIVGNPAGNCGYNLPYAGIALSKGCAGPEDHTWAHEVGHNLNLPHPFLGWEGDVYDPTRPTPTHVTYNYTFFKDTLILDTMIIDTTEVELVDRSNCTVAADGFCDTHPDYISARWTCNGNGESPNEMRDPNGEAFRADGSLIMSYANDRCQTRFTPDQMTAMRAALMTNRSEYIHPVLPLEQIRVEAPVIISPQKDEVVDVSNSYFEWEEIDHAENYVLQVSRLPGFNFIVVDTVINGTSAIIQNLRPDTRYFWRVKAFNSFSFCNEFSGGISFMSSMPTSTSHLNNSPWSILNNVVESGQYIHFKQDKSDVVNDLDLHWYTLDGRLITTEYFDVFPEKIAAPQMRGTLILKTISSNLNQSFKVFVK